MFASNSICIPKTIRAKTGCKVEFSKGEIAVVRRGKHYNKLKSCGYIFILSIYAITLYGALMQLFFCLGTHQHEKFPKILYVLLNLLYVCIKFQDQIGSMLRGTKTRKI